MKVSAFVENAFNKFHEIYFSEAHNDGESVYTKGHYEG